MENPKGIQAPENTLADFKPTDESMDTQFRKVLDHMARLDFNIDAEKGTKLISFYHSYQDYLDHTGYADPKEVLKEQAKK